MRRRPPRSTRTDTLVPDTTLCRSGVSWPASDAETLEHFATEYERVYGLRIPDLPVEVVTWRVAAWAPPPVVEVAELPSAVGAPVVHRTRTARFDRGSADVDIPV